MKNFGSPTSNLLLIAALALIIVSCSTLSNPRYYTPSDKYHIVKQGESLASISNIYGISEEKLILFNELKSDRIFPGQRLYLEPKISLKREYVTVRSIPAQGYHIVRSQESITRIAKMYDLSLIEIMNWNNLKTFDLQTGQKIFLEPRVVPPVSEVTPPQEELPDEPPVTEPKITEKPPVKDKHVKHSGSTLPLNGMVTSEFGMRNGKPHKGIDIGSDIGVPILAALDGEVVYVGTQRGYGNVIILEHQDYIMTVYAHNETNLVRQGDHVTNGQPIATVGNTGTTSGPHLHFEYRVQGIAVDPRKLFPEF